MKVKTTVEKLSAKYTAQGYKTTVSNNPKYYEHVSISGGTERKDNRKLGSIPTFSTAPIISCGNCSGCKHDCYALKNMFVFRESIRKSWIKNFAIAKHNRAQVWADIDKFLTKKQPRTFRYHVSGDILDQQYLNSMSDMAKKHSNTKFLAFTKMYHLDYSDIPDNLKIVVSVWPGMEFDNPNNFPLAFVQDGTETRVENALECEGTCETCGMCWDLKNIGKNVVFHKH